ncbi:MAG: FkbM family methyltransferase [Planctomycetota bacterium]|nr:MAG: FkbM family methyltransferase [Planctomycetota bacterium]
MEFRTRSVRVPSLGFEFEIIDGDTIIGPSIEKGAWEPHETALFQAHLERGARVLDLGANIGWFAVQAILAGAEVHAFEPVPAIAAIAERNISNANRRGPGIGKLYPFAAGAQKGRASIALARGNHGDNRVVDGAVPSDMQGAETVAIAIERVDDHLSGPFRVIKIDTQGSEWLALQGAQKLVEASTQCALLMEFWPYALRGCKPEELLGWLDRLGYTLGKATAAPFPMRPERILKQALARDPVKGGLDLYGTRGVPFHVLGLKTRLHGMWRSNREA